MGKWVIEAGGEVFRAMNGIRNNYCYLLNTIKSMSMFATIAGVIAALVWVFLLLARGKFWQARRLITPMAPVTTTVKIAVIIPARNEAQVIARSVTSLLHQTCSSSIHIFLIDDGSTDHTAQIARWTARQ